MAPDHSRAYAGNRSPALAGIIGARRARTAPITSSLSILQVDGGDAEVGVPELALDHVQRHPLAAISTAWA